MPIFHQALARDLDRPHPIAVLNVGGVANVTFVDGGDPIACDTGPGNALIDDFMRARTGAPLDRDGDQAAHGRVDEAFVERVLADEFFGRPYPKSLDRNAFAFANIGLPDFSVADGAATLSALTAASVARIVPHLPAPLRAWIVAGGGARNPTFDAHACRAAQAGERGDGRRGRLVVAVDRGAGLRLSGGAHAQWFAVDLSQNDRRGDAVAGRIGGAAVPMKTGGTLP